MLKEIEEFEDYQISDDGRVWSKKSNKWLKPNMDSGGYFFVCLCKYGVVYHKLIHRLVAETFIPNPDNKNEIDHINTLKNDNRISNLRWATRKDNMNNTITKQKMIGRKHSEQAKKKMSEVSPKKTVYQYTLDGKLVKIWVSTNECGRNGFNQSHVWACCKGKRKTHKGFKWSYNKI